MAIKDTLHSNEHAREPHVPTQQQYEEATRHSTLHQQYDPYDPTKFQSMREDYANHSATKNKSSVHNEDALRRQAQAVGLAQLPAGESPLGALGGEMELGCWRTGAWGPICRTGGLGQIARGGILERWGFGRLRACGAAVPA